MMNEDYVLRNKYRRLYYSLNNIRRSMSNVKSNTNSIKTLTSNTVKVNKKDIEEGSFNKLNSLNDNINSSLSAAISSVSSKM